MLNRYMCEVLDEMRTCNKVRNYAPLGSLIEEVQIMGNRMEAKLADMKDAERYHEELKELKKQVKKLRKEKEKLENA